MVLGDDLGTELRLIPAAVGVLAGVFLYRVLMPKADPSDVQ